MFDLGKLVEAFNAGVDRIIVAIRDEGQETRKHLTELFEEEEGDDDC